MLKFVKYRSCLNFVYSNYYFVLILFRIFNCILYFKCCFVFSYVVLCLSLLFIACFFRISIHCSLLYFIFIYIWHFGRAQVQPWSRPKKLLQHASQAGLHPRPNSGSPPALACLPVCRFSFPPIVLSSPHQLGDLHACPEDQLASLHASGPWSRLNKLSVDLAQHADHAQKPAAPQLPLLLKPTCPHPWQPLR